ncbi:hypothetical protein GCM10025868_19040 [Angustibacter aerolatus]|uniref:AB hydrolase-1 domain-containing protein n=1 Tax=Angustibacter aerolatus TaxID=1162965 RepID=A0ABQ6JFS7_9ACTN|nr:hypothetical protein GCM10025868_19040 [Angustibacter aerolatus]
MPSLAADVVVTATGLDVQAMGGVRLTVDGTDVRLRDTVSYKGMMLSGVPNLAYAIGYTNRLVDAEGRAALRALLSVAVGHGRAGVRHRAPGAVRPRHADPAAARLRGGLRAARRRPAAAAGRPRAVDDVDGLLGRRRAAWVPTACSTPSLHLSRAGDPAGGEAARDRFVDLPAGPRICYRVDGPDDGMPLLLVAGLGLDLTSWPQPMVDGFVGRGFRVIRFDNRDIGRSSRADVPRPGRLRRLLARPRPDAYDLGDMAADAYGLLDHLGVDRAHLVGMSMGGMIAQTLAARHPDHVATLTSVFSTTGHRGVGQPARSTLRYLARRPARTVEESLDRHRTLLQHIGSPTLLPDDDVEAAWARGVWERGGGRRARAGVPRQIGAIQASGDRTPEPAAHHRADAGGARRCRPHGAPDRRAGHRGGDPRCALRRGSPRWGTTWRPGWSTSLVEPTTEPGARERVRPRAGGGGPMSAVRGKVAVVTGAGSGIGRRCRSSSRGAAPGWPCRTSTRAGWPAPPSGRAPWAPRCTRPGSTSPTARPSSPTPARWRTTSASCTSLYNNAGVAGGSGVLDSEWVDYDRILGVNLMGVVHGTKAFLPHLIASGDGHVVNVSSLNGVLAQASISAYSASKFAVRGFTESLRSEMLMTRHPVQVTVVHPGGVRTNIANAAMAQARAEGRLTPDDERRTRMYNDKPASDAARAGGEDRGRRRGGRSVEGARGQRRADRRPAGAPAAVRRPAHRRRPGAARQPLSLSRRPTPAGRRAGSRARGTWPRGC